MELQCLLEGLPADHEWFDAVTDARAALDPSVVRQSPVCELRLEVLFGAAQPRL
jgi:hypothetical protein